MRKYTIGIDFGTLSARAVLMDVQNGDILETSVCEYKHGVFDRELPSGKKLSPKTALQVAEDYKEALIFTVRDVISKARITVDSIVGLGIDCTACTILPVDKDMQPLTAQVKYQNEPHAYVKLWKHNSATIEGDKITQLAKTRGENWLARYGGKTSGEWTFAKLLQICEENPELYDDTYMFMNCSDWLVYLLTGKIVNNENMASYKWLWNEETGFPDANFFNELHPKMSDVVETKIPQNMAKTATSAGKINEKGSKLVGLLSGTIVSTPVIDAHASMPALGIINEGMLMMVVGTSGAYLVHSKDKKIPKGIMGCAKDSIVPGMYSYEAAQACCGDHLDWYIKNCIPASYTEEAQNQGVNIHQYLRQKAQKLEIGESGLVCLDWFNGNRSIIKDLGLTGAIFGLTLQTKPEEIYRALMEGAIFGTKRIIDNFRENGIEINEIIATGGIAEKDEMYMQICADVFNCEVKVSKTNMSAAKGSAIYAAVALNVYPNLHSAVEALVVKEYKIFRPIAKNVEPYKKLYEKYVKFHDYFGNENNDLLRGKKKN